MDHVHGNLELANDVAAFLEAVKQNVQQKMKVDFSTVTDDEVAPPPSDDFADQIADKNADINSIKSKPDSEGAISSLRSLNDLEETHILFQHQ